MAGVNHGRLLQAVATKDRGGDAGDGVRVLSGIGKEFLHLGCHGILPW